MSSIKEYLFELDYARDEWIKAQLGDPDANESTIGWAEYESKYYEHRFTQSTEDEFVWYSNLTSESLFDKFQNNINMLRDVISHNHIAVGLEVPIYKMAYAHAVTLLETFLSETIKSLIITNDSYFENAIRKLEELKKANFSLIEVWRHPEGIKGLAVERLSDVLYHNIPKVKLMLEAITGIKLKADIAQVTRIAVIRHDIVHRNGKTTEGNVIELNIEVVEKAIDKIESFVALVHRQLEEEEPPF